MQKCSPTIQFSPTLKNGGKFCSFNFYQLISCKYQSKSRISQSQSAFEQISCPLCQSLSPALPRHKFSLKSRISRFATTAIEEWFANHNSPIAIKLAEDDYTNSLHTDVTEDSLTENFTLFLSLLSDTQPFAKDRKLIPSLQLL
jgi:hypothetical protein